MPYRRLGSAGLEVSAIGLSTWQFSGEWGKRFSPPEVDELIGPASELGVNLIDTAECYGDHLAESLVGHAIASDRERWVVATKFGHGFHAERMESLAGTRWRCVPTTGPRRRSAGSSRTRCARWAPTTSTSTRPHGGSDADLETPGLWAALREQVRAGKIRHLGISLEAHDGARARRAPDVGAEIIQVPYSRLQREAEEHVLPACAELRLGVLAREPLAHGYLSGKYKPGSRITSPNDWRSHHDPQEVEAKLEAVAQIQATEVPPGLPLAQWALTSSLRHPAVGAVVPGNKNIEQLESNVAAADLDLVSGAHPLAMAR